jgi:hypothetical protein
MSFPWQEPWASFPDGARAAYQLQLARELVPAHPLFNSQLVLLGKHEGTDDVLVQREDGSLAVVHLTWAGTCDAQYPRTTFFSDWGDFATHRMGPDALEYR